jgi:hypothetical protein
VSDSAIGAPARSGDSASLAAAVGQLFGSGRELVADAADLVAAEAHVALR